MATIDHFNLRSFDLNLFLAFDAIMTDRNVTRAAKRLRVRQPAMSHSLSTLRMLFQDELFIRRGQIMEPTPYALHLAVPVRQVLAQAQDAVSSRTKFATLSQPRVFRIALSSHLAAMILPDLFAEIRAEAPNVQLVVRETDKDAIPDLLKRGHYEIGIGCFELKHSWINQEILFPESHVCCFNSKLLEIGNRIGTEEYFGLPHITIATKDDPFGCLERAFAELGRSPNVAMSVSHFLPATTTAARLPVLTTLPATLATKYAAPLGLTLSPLPFDVETLPVSMAWHFRLDGDESVAWLRRRIKEAVKLLRAEIQLPDFLQ
jgi:LysR family transcriptional regulator, mexEF-oprN operon transcriptional activator